MMFTSLTGAWVPEERRMPATVGERPFQSRRNQPRKPPLQCDFSNCVNVPWSLTVEVCVREDLECYIHLSSGFCQVPL